MSCTTNTLTRNYTAVKGSNLILSGNMLALGVAMNLAGYEFRMEISTDPDFLDVTIPDQIATISANTYTFNLAITYPATEYRYRITMKDSLGNVFHDPIRAGRITVKE